MLPRHLWILLPFCLLGFIVPWFRLPSLASLSPSKTILLESSQTTVASTIRQYPIKSPRSIGISFFPQTKHCSVVGLSSSAEPPEKGRSPQEAQFTPDFQHFVIVGEDGQLSLRNKTFFLSGANNYYLQTRSAWIPDGRLQVDRVFAFAKRLGMNTLRTWAFGEGDVWNALHPLPGIIDEDMFKDGLDYVVYQARLHGIRLILSLANYNHHLGGMPQYIRWTNLTSISDFYTSSEIKEMFKDYIYAVIHRVNAHDKVMYKDNPTILGWELANEPRDPGYPGSINLQSWIEEMSAYVKSLDPHHLVMVGVDGFYGPSTPQLLNSNPSNMFQSTAVADIPLFQNNAVCEGEDFWRNHQPRDIDIAAVHLYPDSWLHCEEACALNFSKQWIHDHARLAKKLRKPLLIGEFGKLKPQNSRNRFFKVVHEALYEAIREELPIAGSLVWMLADEDYLDYDGFTIFSNHEASFKKRVSLPFPQYMEENLVMFNYETHVQCLIDHLEQDTHGRERFSDGWETTQQTLTNHSQVMDIISTSLMKEEDT